MNRRLSRLAIAVAISGVAGVAPVAMADGATASSLPSWLHNGTVTVYPSAGGTWQYGFWNTYIRSYYWVGKCHGSSVVLNGDLVRSVDTAANQKSVAEKFAINGPNMNDEYYFRIC